MVFMFSAVKNIFNDETSAARKLLPGFFLLIYATIGAGIFYALEKNGPCPMDNFWTAMYFVGTIYTTVGTGNVAPCTVGGRLMTVPYTLFGIPLALITLDSIGYILAKYSGTMWARIKFVICWPIHRIRRKRGILPKKIVSKKAFDEEKDRPKLPILLGLGLTVHWTLLTALLYAVTEGWMYFESLYFVFISITTIGFGDVYPTHFHWCILQYAFLMVNLALFSMNINLLQESLENLTGRISDTIMQQYLAKLQNDESGEFTEVDFEDEDKAKAKISEIIRKQPGGKYLQFFMSRKAEKSLITELQERGRMRNKGIQVEPTVTETGCDAELFTTDASTQVSISKEARLVAVKDKGQQLDWLPKMRFEPNWMDIHGYNKKKNKISKQSKERMQEVGHPVREQTHSTSKGLFRRKGSGSSSGAASSLPISDDTAQEVDSDILSDVHTI